MWAVTSAALSSNAMSSLGIFENWICHRQKRYLKFWISFVDSVAVSLFQQWRAMQNRNRNCSYLLKQRQYLRRFKELTAETIRASKTGILKCLFRRRRLPFAGVFDGNNQISIRLPSRLAVPALALVRICQNALVTGKFKTFSYQHIYRKVIRANLTSFMWRKCLRWCLPHKRMGPHQRGQIEKQKAGRLDEQQTAVLWLGIMRLY